MAQLKIKAKDGTFRRSGIAFTETPIIVDTKQLTEEQVEALYAETNLVVVDVTDDEQPEQSAPVESTTADQTETPEQPPAPQESDAVQETQNNDQPPASTVDDQPTTTEQPAPTEPAQEPEKTEAKPVQADAAKKPGKPKPPKKQEK